MSERLTDEELDDLLGCANDKHVDINRKDAIHALAELRERRALDDHRRSSDEELIQRRAADLSAQEVEALKLARSACFAASFDHAMSVVSKLIAAAEARRG